MKKEIFDISKFNIIQDDENYYVFRALNMDDQREISEGINSANGNIERVLTNKQRYPQNNKYASETEISLKEVWDHTKSVNFYRGTNCISLSSNANVSIDYGSKYGHRYLMIKVPKEQSNQIYNAGQYMLSELNKVLENTIKEIPQDSEIIKLIHEIEGKKSYSEVKNLIGERFKSARTGERYTSTDNIRARESMILRFNKRQAFFEEQQLEYNKVIGKLTLLEIYGMLPKEIFNTINIPSLTRTIGSEFSNREFVHYGEISSNEFVPISKVNLDMFALLQIAKEQSVDTETINEIERRLIEYTNQGYDLIEREGKLYYSNGKEEIDLHIGNDSVLINENNLKSKNNFSIEEIFDRTNGSISYSRAKNATQFVYNLSIAQRKTIELAKVLKLIMNDSKLNTEIEEIAQKSIAINDKIITRKNGRGIQVSESVNIDMNRGEKKEFSDEEQRKIYAKVTSLSIEELETIISNTGIEIEQDILQGILEKKEEISENQYFAEAIVDGIDFEKIYKTTTGEKRIITEDERNRLVSRLNSSDCKKLYNAFINAGVNSNDIPGYIINLLMDNGYKGHTLQELSRLEDLDRIIEINTKNLNCRIQALRLDKTLGIEDDSYVVPETSIRLRDYQQDTVQNIDRIHENKRFAGMVLPTGAGKSFVAMTEMMKYKNSNIIFIAPQNTILSQFQNHILKNILNKKVITDEEIEELRKEGKEIPEDRVRSKDAKKVIEEAFPHLKMFCYATLSSRDEEWLKSQDADFIILDELHRAGAATWKPQIQKLLENNPNAKILGMTATPVRDADHEDMARILAEMCGDYTEKELIHKEYLASEMHVLDAMQDNIVVSPKIVTFDYNLETSEEYQEVRRMIQEEQDLTKKEELKRIYKEMTAIIKKSEKQGMNGILAENIKKKNGRYIVFLPNNTTELSSEEYIKAEIEKVKEYFRDVNQNIQTGYLLSNRENAKAENAAALEEFENSDSEELKLLFALDMLNEGVHVDGIDGAVMLRPISENSKILYLQQIGRCIFSLDPNNPIADEDRPVIFDVYNNYLAQNMDREANKTTPTSDLQRLQAITKWIYRHNGYMPDINSEDKNEARRAVTLKNIQKKYKRYMEGIENKNLSESEIYEIQQILELGKSIELWDLEIPQRIVPPGERDIVRNDTFRVTGTQREFVDLFKKAKAVKKDRKLSTGLRIKNTLYILDVLSEYGIEISNETIQRESTLEDILSIIPIEIKKVILEEIDVLPNFNLGEEYELAKMKFYSGEKIFSQYSIDELRRYGIFESFEIGTDRNGETIYKSCMQGDFIQSGPMEFRNINIKTNTLWNEEGYNIYDLNKYGFSKNRLYYGIRENGKKKDSWGCQRDPEGYDADGINEYNLGRNGHYYIKQKDGTWQDTGRLFNEQGFDLNGYYWEEQEDGTFTKTDSKFGKDGFDMYGFDEGGFGKDGYNIYGLNKFGFSKNDGLYYGLSRDGKKKNNNGVRRDFGGYNAEGVDKQGFGREGYYWEKQEDGTFIKTDSKFGRDGYNRGGLDKFGFGRDKLYYGLDENGLINMALGLGKSRDTEGYDVDGINELGFGRNGHYYEKQRTGRRKDTGKIFNEYGFDINGHYWEEQEDGSWKDTGSLLNKQGFDINGYYWEEQEDGTFTKTDSKFGKDGYSIDGVNKKGFAKDNLYYGVDQNGKRTGRIGNKRDLYGFDADGYYYEKQENGTYRETGLKYNKFGFKANYKHKITKNFTDIRGFNVAGICTRNNQIYDENGFKQDGTYLETGELYHNGYNAFGVDKNGYDKQGKKPIEIIFIEEYISGVSKGKMGEVLKKYDINSRDRLNIMFYTATEMRPQLKQVISMQIMNYQKMIQQRQQKIEQLEIKKAENKQEIERLQKENSILRKRISFMNPLQELEK